MCKSKAALFVILCLFSNVLYTVFMMFVLKYGSTSKLFMAQTILVPIGNLAFALPIMPQQTSLHVSDLLGLGVIMGGLALYRFMEGVDEEEEQEEDDAPGDGTTPWFQEMMQQLREPLILSEDV